MKSFKPLMSTLALGLCTFSFSAYAQSTAPQSTTTPMTQQSAATGTHAGGMTMSKDDISNRYKAEKKRCDSLKGNDKDVCQKQAKADRDSAKADAKMNKKDAEARHDAMKDKSDAQYKVAKEKCDAMSGDTKDTCIANAKTQYKK